MSTRPVQRRNEGGSASAPFPSATATPPRKEERRRPPRFGLDRLAPGGFFVLKLAVSAGALAWYLPRHLRLTYTADGLARAMYAYDLAYGKFEFLQTHQFQPLHLWLWAALLRLYPDIYWSGTALNVVAGAGTALFLYLLGKRLAHGAVGALAATLFIFSPVHHNVTLSMGMAESVYFFFTVAGVYAACRTAEGGRGAAAAGFLLAAAALCRFEGGLLLLAYSGYRLYRTRPRRITGWALWAAPLAAAGFVLGVRVFAGPRGGLGPLLPGLKTDMAFVLTNLHWYRRTYYGLERLWLDGRLAAAFGVAGAAWVWGRGLGTAARRLASAAAALVLVGLTVLVTVIGTGFSPERYFAAVLLLLFPFAGVTAFELWTRTRRRKFLRGAVAFGLVAALAYTAYFDRSIRDYGYGHAGPCGTCLTAEAELGLKLRALWRDGRLKPDEVIYLEEYADPGNYSNFGLRAFSDHPSRFFMSPAWQTERDLWYLPFILNRSGVRIAIFVNGRSRHQLKSFYRSYRKRAVIYENPLHTVVVLRRGWPEGVPDFASRRGATPSKVIR